MFGLPSVIQDAFPSLNQGVPDPIPAYEEILPQITLFWVRFRWLLLLPTVGLGVSFGHRGNDKRVAQAETIADH